MTLTTKKPSDPLDMNKPNSDSKSGTMPVRDAHQMDADKLGAYLEAEIDGFRAPVAVEEFRGGQSNPTYRLTDANGKTYVLRRKPPGKLLPSAHAVDREYKVMTALASTPVPVPVTYLMCDDEDIAGTPFFVMDMVDGRIFWDVTLPELEPVERGAIYDAMNDTIAKLHQVDYRAIGLSEFGREGGYVARQIKRWSQQYRASETETIGSMEKLIEWLPAHLPEEDETCLVHGDFRLDNMIFHPTEPRVLAVLDWEISTLGHPLADFSYHCMLWRMPKEGYRGLVGYDLAALGIPSEEEYVAAYIRRSGGKAVANWDFYMAYNMFRMGAILQGVMGRVRDGTAASEEAKRTGAMAGTVADAAWDQVEKMG